MIGKRLIEALRKYLPISLIVLSFWEIFIIPLPFIGNSQRLLVVVGLIGVIINKNFWDGKVNKRILLMAGLVVWSIVCSWEAIETNLAFNNLITILGSYLVFVVFTFIPEEKVNMTIWYKVWLICGVITLVLITLMVFSGNIGGKIIEIVFGSAARDWFSMEYLRGRWVPLGGIYITFLLPLIKLYKKEAKQNVVWLSVLTAGVVGVLVSNYRSMVVGMVVGLMIVGAGMVVKCKVNFKWLILAAIILMLGIRMTVGDRFLMKDRSDVTTLETRWGYFVNAWQLFKENPIIGVGAGNFTYMAEPMVVKELNTPDTYEMPAQTHNQLLSWITETGLPGAILYVVLIISFAVRDWKLWHGKNVNMVWIVLMAMSWVYVVGSMLDAYPAYGTYTFFIIRGILEHDNISQL